MGRTLIVAIVLTLFSQVASAIVIQRMDWTAVNYWEGVTWCEGECLDNLAAELGVDVSDPNSIEISGTIEQRRGAVGGGTGGSFAYRLSVNDGSEETPLCELVTGPFSDTMSVRFDVTDSTGAILASGSGLLCGEAAEAPEGFAPAETPEGSYWHEPLEGNGWLLMAVVWGISEREVVPEPGTLALLGLGLVGLGLGRRRRMI